jgi:hypothetical protein
MDRFNAATRMDLEDNLDFLNPVLVERVIRIFEEKLLIPLEFREVK